MPPRVSSAHAQSTRRRTLRASSVVIGRGLCSSVVMEDLTETMPRRAMRRRSVRRRQQGPVRHRRGRPDGLEPGRGERCARLTHAVALCAWILAMGCGGDAGCRALVGKLDACARANPGTPAVAYKCGDDDDSSQCVADQLDATCSNMMAARAACEDA